MLKDGRRLPADMVLLGVGVTPATQFLRSSGLELQRDGSILVDEHMRVQGKENVYAVGDIATFPRHGKLARIEHWGVAQKQGRVAGMNIAGKSKSYTQIPYFWTVRVVTFTTKRSFLGCVW